MNKKGFVNILIVVIGIIIVAGAVGYYLMTKKVETPISKLVNDKDYRTFVWLRLGTVGWEIQLPKKFKCWSTEPQPCQDNNDKVFLKEKTNDVFMCTEDLVEQPIPSATYCIRVGPLESSTFSEIKSNVANGFKILSEGELNGHRLIKAEITSKDRIEDWIFIERDNESLIKIIVSKSKKAEARVDEINTILSSLRFLDYVPASWTQYAYSSLESGILPNITFKYPSLFGNGPTLISSRNTNRPGKISNDWGGLVEFNPTGAFGDRGLRMEFFKRTNYEGYIKYLKSADFEPYVIKVAAAGGWDAPKYFSTGQYRVARLRFSSLSHYDADVGWYLIDFPPNNIIAISTSGDKKYLYDDDQNGNSTRDIIISTIKIAQ